MNDLIAVQKIAGWEKLKTLVLDSVSSPIVGRIVECVRVRQTNGNCGRTPHYGGASVNRELSVTVQDHEQFFGALMKMLPNTAVRPGIRRHPTSFRSGLV